MSNALFPSLRGLSWGVKKTPEWSTLTQKAAAPGYETRIQLGPDPLYHFECDFEFLAEGSYGSGVNELDRLEGFFNQRGGDFDSFLLSLPLLTQNPAHGSIAGQVLTPDSNNVAPLVITRDPAGSSYNENIYEVAGVNGNPLIGGAAAPVIRKDGTTLAAGID